MSVPKEELRMHRNNILNLINQILNDTEDIQYEEFRKDESMKEQVFSQLQEIGEASREIVDMTNEYEDDQELAETLDVLRNARYNQEAEFGLDMVWGIIKNDLPEIEEMLTRKIREDQDNEEENK